MYEIFNINQIKFLNKLRDIGIDNVIDTEMIWGLSSLSIFESNSITEKELIRYNDTIVPRVNRLKIWDKIYAQEWLDGWITTNRFYIDNYDRDILNSLGCYYRRYRIKSKP